jgi:hypothetical protein
VPYEGTLRRYIHALKYAKIIRNIRKNPLAKPIAADTALGGWA